jgi:Right handed beta helix region
MSFARRTTIVTAAPWAFLPVLVVLAGGCNPFDKRLRPEFCAAHPADEECRRTYPDAGDPVCMSNASCMAPTPVCDLAGSRKCVQCVAPSDVSACTGTTPACGADNACHACSKHADCPASSACLPDGSCAMATQVAYVDPLAGSGSTCTLAAPCKKVSDALGTARPYVKLSGTIDEAVTINNQNVTVISAPGAKLTRTNPGVILKVDGTSTVLLVDLTVADGLGGTGIGISLPAGNSASLTLLRATVSNNAGGGIVASGGSLVVSQSTITGNSGGGLSLSTSQFDITNTFIVSNGGAGTPFGGVRFDQTSSGTRRFDFNTVTNNVGADGSALGVVCTLVTQAVSFSDNIVYGNQVGGTRTQVGGAMCAWRYSDIGPDTAPGMGNLAADPMFVNPGQNNFHLQNTSPAKDMADPDATLSVDFDGDARPQGLRRDIGADEIR